MNWVRVIGVTFICSSVPSSRSRAMFWAVTSVPMMVINDTRIAGTM